MQTAYFNLDPYWKVKWSLALFRASLLVQMVKKKSACSAGDLSLILGSRRPIPVFLAGESHGQRSLAGYSLWGRKELDTTEWLRQDIHYKGFPGDVSGKEPTCQCRRHKEMWVKKIPWRKAWQHTPVFLPRESHGQRNLVGYSLCSLKESGTTEAT